MFVFAFFLTRFGQCQSRSALKSCDSNGTEDPEASAAIQGFKNNMSAVLPDHFFEANDLEENTK